jgi:hypothetical protein
LAHSLFGEERYSRETACDELCGGVAGPLSEKIYFRDYWLPGSVLPIHVGNFSFRLEDILWGFAIGGIAAVSYEIFFRERLSQFSLHSKRTISSLGMLFILYISIEFFLSLGWNSIYATSFAFLVAAIPILFFRHDLFLNAIGSGMCVMLIMFVSYLILFNVVFSNTAYLFSKEWLIYNTPLDHRLWNIPLTEMVWGFTWGFFAGPWYEFATRRKDIALK